MQKNSYNYDELISCGEGKLFGEGNAKLPLPPMLMFDRITEIKKDTGGRNKAPNIASIKTSEKPGWTMAEGTNFWVVNEKDPYWQTTEGYKEAVDLYGFKPGWVKEPVKKTNVVNLQPTRRISL